MLSKFSFASSLLAAALASAQNISTGDLLTGACCACTQLAATYGDLLITSDSSDYTAEATAYWDLRADLLPQCIFMPTDATQVAAAVSTFTSCGAQFAIRGGGHMNYPGSNNIDGGVLLALNNLTELSIASDNSSIAAGPGNTWVDVYTALGEYGLYCIGGRMKSIGISGLNLIGGFHYLINKYGMAMDNVISYDAVLGNGTQVVANSTSNPDLFWALKGGANNFAIVTKFTIKALPIPQISVTIQSFNESETPAFIQATNDMAENNPADIAAGSIVSINYNTSTGATSASLIGVQEGTESPPSRFANYSAIPSTSATNIVQTPVEWHSQLDTPFQTRRYQFAHKTMKPNSTQMSIIYDDWKVAVNDILDVEGLFPTFVMNILSKSSLSVAKNNGIGNTWGLDDEQDLIIWQLSSGWDHAEDDIRMTNWARCFIDKWHQVNQDLGIASEFIYMGDAGEFQDPFAGFPSENVQRMKEIQESVDPSGVFTKLNRGGFKLSH